MRKITRDAVNAFRNNEKFSRGNTEVRLTFPGSVLYLHGNAIAVNDPRLGDIKVRSAGWETPTTKERLNGILSAIGCQGIYQKDFTWYWDDGTEFGDGWQVARE